MRIEFVAPDLRKLDRLRTDALVLFLHEDDTPLPDLRGLVDWRLCGALSRLLLDGKLKGTQGETLLMPVRNRFPFERLLVLGLGPARPLQPDEVAAQTRRLLHTLARIKVHSAAVALPGRPYGQVDPLDAVETLLHIAPESPDIDELILVEPPQIQRAVSSALDLGRRH